MIRKAFYWSASTQIVSFLVAFSGSVIVARLLSPREMGIYAVSLATMGVLQIFASFGVGEYVIRAVQLDDETVDSAFTLNALISIALAAGIYSISHIGARFLSDSAVAPVLQLLSIIPLLSILNFRPSVMLQREIEFRSISIVGLTATIFTTGTTVTAAYFGASYMSQAYGGVIGALISSIGLAILGRRHFAIRFSIVAWRPMLAFGMQMMSIGGISALAARLSDIILGHMLGLPALGLFGRASNLATMIFSNMYGTITRVVFVKLSQDYREHGKLREPFLKWLRVIAGFMGPVLLGLAVLSKPAILLLYGEKWLGAALPLSLLMVAHFIALRFAMNWELFVIRDQLKVQTALEFVRSVVSLFNRAIGCLFGLVGAAVASIVDAIFSIVLYGKQIDRLIEAEPNDLMHATAGTIGITFAAIFPAFVLMVWTGWDAHTPLPLVSASVAMGAIFWLVTLAWLRHPLFEEIRSLAANLLMRCSPVARRGLTILGRRSQ